MNKKSLIIVAKDNEIILGRGSYTSPSGASVDVETHRDASVEGTLVYTPDDLHQLLGQEGEPTSKRPRRIEVVEGKAGEVARRVAKEDGVEPLVLNFASAKNPGGGYVRGTRAQEEDLARCSLLYFNLVLCTDYYAANRICGSALYTDHMIYSPGVPFFRDDDQYELLEEVVPLAVITAPAPNADAFLLNTRGAGDPSIIQQVMERRVGMVLALAEEHKHRVLVLGAWGCGVFKNDPKMVASIFADWLARPRFAGCFDRVVFAIYVREDNRHILETFQEFIQ